jgi:hypothetical protein
MTRRVAFVFIAVLAFAAGACSGKPSDGSLRDAFADQLKANRAARDFERHGDDLTFTGPTLQGGTAKWRVHLDSATIEDTGDERAPYKGTVKSSWFADGQQVKPQGRESNLPDDLISNGLAQECWALWDPAAKKWGW